MQRTIIHVLSPETVSKIAAGEVVERPASVVKELVENSLDASASQISIEVRGSGVNFIRVSDNGTGIPADEAELAFQRHATSKITTLADLDGATSLGFRGEALPSIAQVAQVEMLTCSKEDASGVYLSLREGRIVKREARACPQGTTVTVRNLFRNVPARLKFLKSATTENNQITNLVSQYALAFPEVRFTLAIDGRSVLRTPGSGRLRDALAEVYGLDMAQAMLEIKGNAKEAALTPTVSGYVSLPSISRASRNCLSFFVNRRWVQSRLLAGAVEKAYEGWLPVRRYPVVAINLSIVTYLVDVNVHPTKREVRFDGY
jgi:DNA mismatch repair protein MutL